MDKISILMDRGVYESWAKAHPLSSRVAVTIEGQALDGTVSEFAEYHGRFEVRIRLARPRVELAEKGAL